VLGGIQPDLFRCAYGQRGDDGLLDRLLLVGDGVARPVSWPRNADDPALNDEWSSAIDRLLHMEELASDSLGEHVEARFTPAAIDVCRRLENQLNQLVVLIGVPESQYGVVAKLRQHAVKLALLHRCFRWAAGEFGEDGPLGDVDADSTAAACEATLFFFGRWLIWRPELRSKQSDAEGCTIGLRGEPGDDPALQALATMADGAHRVICLIERLVRYVRYRGNAVIAVDELAVLEPLAHHSREELRGACQWLVEQGQGEWADQQAGTFRLVEIPKSRVRGRRSRSPHASKKKGLSV
jgi:hypothetical protein